jgi:ketosteroid isomerase-like protein
MAETNAQLARRAFDAALDGDLDIIAGLLDPDVTWHGGDPGGAGGCRNRGETLTFMRQALAHLNAVELVDVVGAGDKVAVIMRPTRAGGEATTIANLATFRNGRIVEMVHYPDPDEARAAAGA